MHLHLRRSVPLSSTARPVATVVRLTLAALVTACGDAGPAATTTAASFGDPTDAGQESTVGTEATGSGAATSAGVETGADTVDASESSGANTATGGEGDTTDSGAVDCDFDTLVQGQDASAPTLGGPRPALGAFFDDEHYGLPVARVTDASQVTDRDFPAWIRHEYSRRPAFNADSTRAVMISSNGWVRLFDVEPDGTLSFVRTLDVAESQEPNWDATDPDVLYTLEPYGQGKTITRHDVAAGTQEVARDLTARIDALLPGTSGMWTKQEGRPSDDGRVWCLEVGSPTAPGGGFEAAGFIAYDFVADEILGSMPTDETPDHLSTAPSGGYCVISWLYPTGTRAYTTDFASAQQLHDRSEHSDLATTAGGDDVLVYTAYDGEHAGFVNMVALDDGTTTPLFPLYGDNHSLSAFHISGTARDRPGYAVVSSYGCREDYGNAPCDPSAQWFYDKVFLVELAPDPALYNLAHTHYGPVPYWGETQAVANHDLTRVLFVSSWESDAEADLASYVIRVPGCAP
jgi:hypothetical protein